jgi:serine/threonine protein kinase
LKTARAISALNHPNICSLYDVGEQDGVAYLVMELIDGQTLADVIDIAGALDRAHRQGIVHRDLKPGNIMITKSGVKLLDSVWRGWKRGRRPRTTRRPS